MTYKADTPEEYIAQIPAERQGPMQALRQTLLDNLPDGFEECIRYGMIGYVVPHSRYPDGYHCDPKHYINNTHHASFCFIDLSVSDRNEEISYC